MAHPPLPGMLPCALRSPLLASRQPPSWAACWPPSRGLTPARSTPGEQTHSPVLPACCRQFHSPSRILLPLCLSPAAARTPGSPPALPPEAPSLPAWWACPSSSATSPGTWKSWRRQSEWASSPFPACYGDLLWPRFTHGPRLSRPPCSTIPELRQEVSPAEGVQRFEDHSGTNPDLRTLREVTCRGRAAYKRPALGQQGYYGSSIVHCRVGPLSGCTRARPQAAPEPAIGCRARPPPRTRLPRTWRAGPTPLPARRTARCLLWAPATRSAPPACCATCGRAACLAR